MLPNPTRSTSTDVHHAKGDLSKKMVKATTILLILQVPKTTDDALLQIVSVHYVSNS